MLTALVAIGMMLIAMMAMPAAMTPESPTALLNKLLALFWCHLHPAFMHTTAIAAHTEHPWTQPKTAEQNPTQHQQPKRLPEANAFHADNRRQQCIPQRHHQQA
ncbi:hypothetical protein D3C75_1175550 [compost metagenome]